MNDVNNKDDELSQNLKTALDMNENIIKKIGNDPKRQAQFNDEIGDSLGKVADLINERNNTNDMNPMNAREVLNIPKASLLQSSNNTGNVSDWTNKNVIMEDEEIIIVGDEIPVSPTTLFGKSIVIENRNPPNPARGKLKIDFTQKLRAWMKSFDSHPDRAFEKIAVEYDSSLRISAPCIHRAMKKANYNITKEMAYQLLVMFDRNHRGFWMQDEWTHVWQTVLGPLETAKAVARHGPDSTKYVLTPSQIYTVNKLAKVLDADKRFSREIFEDLQRFSNSTRIKAKDIYEMVTSEYGFSGIDSAELILLVNVFDESGSGLNTSEFMRMISPIFRLHQRIY